ncbi:MAG: tRNA pseudouridine(38-40) synthase TruA [Oscillospiraceae bacterium]
MATNGLRNLLVEISYNGANYHGYQVQKNAITITEVVQDAIQKVLKKREDIIGCSRTDSKVHANSYFFNMKTQCPIPIKKLIVILNNALPTDIVLLSCKEVPLEFHARHDCIGKEYIYKIYDSEKRIPFLSTLALHHPKSIDADMLNEVAQQIVGEHDFTSFCSLGFKKGSTMIKNVEYINVSRKEDFVFVKIKANAFLYNMVRIIVGTLLYVNDGKIEKDEIINIINAKDRTKAGKTAEPQGLYLNQVFY